MAFTQPVKTDSFANFRGKFENTEFVCNETLAFAETGGKLLLRELQLVQKGFIAFGLFKIIQILTLKVFNNGHQCGIGVNRGVVNYTERFFRPKAPQRTQTAFTGDKLVCFAVFANDKGLNQSDLPNGLCKLGYAFVIKGFSRLSRVRNDGIQCQFNKLAFCLGRLCACCSAFFVFQKIKQCHIE